MLPRPAIAAPRGSRKPRASASPKAKTRASLEQTRQPVDAIASLPFSEQLASRFDQLFHDAFDLPTSPRGETRRFFYSGSDGALKAREFHDIVFNRGLAAEVAAQPIRASAIEDWFVATGVERRKDLYKALQLHPSTLSRAAADTALDPAITERVFRHSDLLVRAAEVFGKEGTTWMTRPHELLAGKTPLEYASNEFGADKVRSILIAIEYGGVV